MAGNRKIGKREGREERESASQQKRSGEKMKSGRELQTLLEAIKSSEVVENRVQLLKELEELDINENSAVKSVVESLIIYWEDFTCLDISQCTLNKTVLLVAEKYLETDISGFLPQFIVLGTKANLWCRKHLQMTLMSMEDSPEEEHSSCFYQLVLDLLRYSTSSYSALARYPVSIDNELVLSLESFISEQFTLMKDLASEIKGIHTLGPELLKAAQATVAAVTRLCKVYCDGVNWDKYHAKNEDESIRNCNETENGDRVIFVTNCTIKKLCELGTAAANDGGSLVNLLNYSWKGVVSLLQCGKGSLAAKVNITGVIMNLISLATESLRHAAKTWSSMEEKVSVAEAKRIFLPVKFYLINAVRIISQYQTQALVVYKEMALLVVTILTFRISLSMMEHLKYASEVLAEILEPTSLHLLNSLLNSTLVNQEDKFQILDWLFSNGNGISSEAESNDSSCSSLDFIFSLSPDSMNKERILNQGRVALFLTLLAGSPDLEDDILLGISRKLEWLMDILVDEEVYCTILVLQTPSSQNNELTYQPMFSFVLHALKTFIITVSSSVAWNEVESFLIENLFHPHILCWEIVSELWCFILRHAEGDMVNDITDKLCTLLMLTSGESLIFPDSALRKTARVICSLVTYGPESMVDRVFSIASDESKSQNVYLALLMEGFPLNSLSEKKRSIAKQRIVTQYYEYLESFGDVLLGESSVYGAPVFALSAALQSLQVSLSDTDMKTLKFLVNVIRKYKSSSDNATKDDYRRLLGESLVIIANMKHLYSSDEIEEVILEIQKLFITKSAPSDSQLLLCKPNLAYFMAGVGHVELTETESARSRAALELYHMLLKERHWALAHLSVTAFGYFAAYTSFSQLWRFVPQDAALSFDLETGNEAEEERFMEELKAVLEKEMTSLQVSGDQIGTVIKEGRALKEVVNKKVKRDEEVVLMDIVDEKRQPNRKRKFPDGICRGVEVVQSGLKMMVDSLSEWQHESSEVRETFLTHFGRLEDEIDHLANLAHTS